MILKDQHGKRVNANRFRIEADRAYCDGKVSPVFSLLGVHSYADKCNHGLQKENISVLKRMPANADSLEYLLNLKDQYEAKSEAISTQMHEELGELDMGIMIGQEQKWLVEHDYKFFEKDEFHFPQTKDEVEKWLTGKPFGENQLQISEYEEEPEP